MSTDGKSDKRNFKNLQISFAEDQFQESIMNDSINLLKPIPTNIKIKNKDNGFLVKERLVS